jgi:peptidoglycan/LPS O-acetylase OafA/YrhL
MFASLCLLSAALIAVAVALDLKLPRKSNAPWAVLFCGGFILMLAALAIGCAPRSVERSCSRSHDCETGRCVYDEARAHVGRMQGFCR